MFAESCETPRLFFLKYKDMISITGKIFAKPQIFD